MNTERDTLFESTRPFSCRCQQCFDTHLWLSRAGTITICPKICIGNEHMPMNDAAAMLFQFASRLKEKPNAASFFLARVLTHFTSDDPCPAEKLLNYFFSDTNMSHAQQLRKLAYMVEELRVVWQLPVGSRRNAPGGYWIITDIEDCKTWLCAAASAPRTQLVTIWRAARAAFPVLAGQQEFSFMTQMEGNGDVDR